MRKHSATLRVEVSEQSNKLGWRTQPAKIRLHQLPIDCVEEPMKILCDVRGVLGVSVEHQVSVEDSAAENSSQRAVVQPRQQPRAKLLHQGAGAEAPQY